MHPTKRRAPTSLRATTAAALALAVVSISASAGERSEGLAGLAGVEAAIRRVAVEATPKTVCVRVRMADGHEGFGSGAVISADGLVLTCAHVTEPSRGGALTAVFSDGAEAPLAIVASNAKNDYALCRLETPRRDLPHFELAVHEPALGDWVVGLGHPGGPYADHRPTVAVGKVTGLGRRLPILMAGKAYVDALQTDAPLFGGNSGGPLVDLDGLLVGINGAILLVGDASFSSSAVRIGKDLPTLAGGKDVEGTEIEDLFEAMTSMAADLDVDDLAEAFADPSMREMLRAIGPMMRAAGREDAAPRARRRLDDLRDAFPTSSVAAAVVLADGVPIARATPVRGADGRALFVTTARAAKATGTLEVALGADATRYPARVRGVDGTWDLGLLDVAGDRQPAAGATPAPATDADVGAFVLLPGRDGRPFQAGVVAATKRTVGTERRIPTLGIVRLFQPPHTSPFRPYPAMTQIDAPVEADELGGPVVRPDGTLVGVAVAHFNRGATMVVPAAVLPARIERMLAGLDDPAPPTYGEPPRPAPDRARAAAKAAARAARAASMTLAVPTLSGALRPVTLVDGVPDAAGPTVPEDSGVGPLDLHAHDTLVSIGETRTPTVAVAKATIAALAPGAKVAVVLRRGDATIRYEATAEGDGAARKLALRTLAR